MRILIISNYFYPVLNARAFRWGEIARLWASQGHEVSVVSRWLPGAQVFETREGCDIHRVGRGFLERLRGRRESDGGGLEGKGSSVACRIKGGIRSGVKLLHDATWKKVYWPDFGCLWSFAARKKALELLSSKRFDAICSVSLPFSSHLAALACHKRWSRIPWIVDVGDPFSFMHDTPVNNSVLYGKLNVRAERSVIRGARFLTVTNEMTAKRYKECFAEAEGKTVVIPPLVRARARCDDTERHIFDRDKIILVYIGSLFRTIREPDVLLETIRAAVGLRPEWRRKLEVHWFGEMAGCESNFDRFRDVADVSFTHGMVARELVSQIMAEADVLVNIGNTTKFQLPSKIVEYVSSGKPIVNLCSVPDDTSAEVLKDHPLALNIVGCGRAAAETASGILDFIDRSRGRMLDEAEICRLVSAYTADVIAEKYMSLLKEGAA